MILSYYIKTVEKAMRWTAAGIDGTADGHVEGQYARLHGVELDPASEIVITASGVQALNMAVRCAIDPGDEAVVLTPAWPNGSAMISMASGVVRELPQPLSGERYPSTSMRSRPR